MNLHDMASVPLRGKAQQFRYEQRIASLETALSIANARCGAGGWVRRVGILLSVDPHLDLPWAPDRRHAPVHVAGLDFEGDAQMR